MRDSAWYNKLWQTKMQELPLEGDENSAWQNMQGLLDQNMPVAAPVVNPKPKTLLWIKLIALLAIIAALYYAGRHLLIQPKKVIKHSEKHVQLNIDSIENKRALATQHLLDNKQDYKNNATETPNISNKTVENQNADNLPVTKNKAQAANSKSIISGSVYNTNKVNEKPGTDNPSPYAIKSSGAKNILPGADYSNQKIAALHLNKRIKGSNLWGSAKLSPLSFSSKSGKQRNHAHYHNRYKAKGRNKNAPRKNSQTIANAGSSLTNDVLLTNNNNPPALTQKSKDAPLPVKTNTSATGKTTLPADKQPTYDKSKADKSATNNKPKTTAKPKDTKFTLDAKIGANTNTGSNLNPFLGISANYQVYKKLGVSIGINAPSTRIISGSYSKDSLTYVTVDTNKQIKHNTGKLIINGSRKIYYVDIPVQATYKASDRITILAGAVISIPIRAGSNKNTLGPLSSSADTTTVKEVTPYVNSTTINNKVNFSISAGVKYTVKRFYFDAEYLQSTNPYTISSGLGSSKIYYHTIQLGIGYHLFKSKK